MVTLNTRSLETVITRIVGKLRGTAQGTWSSGAMKVFNGTGVHRGKNRWAANSVLLDIYNQKARMEEQESEGGCLNKKVMLHVQCSDLS